MEFLTVQQVAEKWDVSIRRVQTICNESRIKGAKKFGSCWAIPADAAKPIDQRIKSGRYIKTRAIHKEEH